MFIDKFLEIGFTEQSKKHTGVGWVIEYKYYSKYIVPNHYTLIVFSYGKDSNIPVNFDTSEYRLCIHTLYGEYVDSPFQCRLPYAKKEFKQVFKQEIRSQYINKILK